tara:strand:+ start:48 stop:506 length:459 start_codon:yes stop_codon:yes gene_type:complete
MKTLTKVKIGVSILICLLLLSAIARKTRENFQAEINAKNLTSNLKVFGNRNPEEISVSDMTQLGFKIIEEDDNNLANLNTTRVNPNETRTCVLSNKTDEERNLAIQSDTNEAKRQFDLLVQKKMEEVQNRPEHEMTRDPDPCSLLQFPAILS